MLSELEDYDWAEVFGEGGGGNCTAIIPDTAPGDQTSRNTFCREDVAVIYGQSEGERDERSWIVWGQLADGRYFVARGGCDYTGWDCRASNSGNVASTKEELVKFGMDNDERTRFDLELA